MGKNDIYMKSYLSDKARFTDLFNNVVCEGRQRFRPDDMHQMNSVSEVVLKNNEGKEVSVQRYRDILMETKKGEKLILLALENQEEVHYAMPIRSMLYDALNYTEQVKNAEKENRKEKRLMGDGEYLSGLRKRDKVSPVITLVFYYGNREWDGSRDIYGMLDIGNEDFKMFEKYIPNYKINLIQIKDLLENNSFKTDLQWILGMLKYKENKRALIEYVNEHADFFQNIDEDAFGAAKVLLGGGAIPELSVVRAKEKGEINMCKALEDLYWDGVNEGREEGREEGRVEERERFRCLILRLTESGSKTELDRVLQDKDCFDELYQKYHIL